MSVVFLDVSGPAPPQVCWERYAVPAVWPSWAPQIHAVVLDDIPAEAWHRSERVGVPRGVGPFAPPLPAAWESLEQGVAVPQPAVRIVPGLRGRVRALVPPAARFVVTAVDEVERTWSWRVGVGAVRLKLDHGVDACLDGGTLTWLRVTAPGPVIRAYAPLARAALRRLVR
ncbi:SRPBCC family protein [Parafrankia sp. FMc2]|uniref:SRPBCC family protein n=1 Tax=Parafrankia sp. FMc2 TaxID=3233196 RepID=UPI0034D3C87F